MSREWLEHVRAHEDWALEELEAIEAEDRLMPFVRMMWHVHHPTRPLKQGWALHAIAEHLEAVERGEIKRLLINVPPGFMKSFMLHVYFPAWVWGPRKKPDKQFVTWSYGEEITIRDNVRFRDVINSEAFQRHWGGHFSFKGDQNEKKDIYNTRGGYKMARGIKGGATGHRGDFCSIDDPHKVKEAESEADLLNANRFVTETWPTRNNDEHTAFLLIMQRIKTDDCSGTLLDNPDPAFSFDHLCIPMEFEPDHPHPSRTSLGFKDPRTELGEPAFPERFPPAEIDRTKSAMRALGGDQFAEAGQLQQRPAPRGGGLFKAEWFHIVEHPPEFGFTARGWDLAATSKKKNPTAAFTAGVKGCITPDGRIYILDARRDRLDATGVEDLILSTAQQDGVTVPQDIPQDPAQAGKAQVSSLARLLMGFQVFFSTETGEKEDRARPLAAQAGAGNVFLVRGPWNDAFIAEAAVFPRGRYKDQIDAASRMFARLLLMSASGLDVVRPTRHAGST